MGSNTLQSFPATTVTVAIPSVPANGSAKILVNGGKDLRKVLAGRLGGKKTAQQFVAGSDAAKERARRGGLATAARYGVDYFAFIGRKSVGKLRQQQKIKIKIKPVGRA